MQDVIGIILTSLYGLIFNTNKESDVKCVPKVRLISLKLNQNVMSHVFITRTENLKFDNFILLPDKYYQNISQKFSVI